VLSGYIGSADIGAAVLDVVKMVKAANPAARYCCDPVIGDVGRDVFVRPGVPEFFRGKAVPAADIVTPNQFELDHLTGGESKTLAQAFAAIDALHEMGPATVMVTSAHTEETPADCLDLLASDPKGRFRVRTPRLPIQLNGAGDAIAALFTAHYLRAGSAGKALSNAASIVYGLLAKTMEAGSREILLIAAQDEIVKPTQVFEAEALGS
jgi:pyridoxine kinase